MIKRPIPEQNHFRVAGGPSLASLRDLRDYLARMPAEQYRYHANAHKNDFAQWINDVFGETSLADSIRHCRGKEELRLLLDESIGGDAAGKQDKEVQEVHEPPPQSVVPPSISPPSVSPPSVSPLSAPHPPQLLDAKALENDDIFDPLKDDITKRNDSLNEKYDQIATRLQEAIKDQLPKELEKLADQLKSRYDEIAAKISEARKQGHEVLIPALVLRQFPAKLALAKATRNEQDFKFASIVLDQAAFELQEALQERQVDVKREVGTLAEIQMAAPQKGGA